MAKRTCEEAFDEFEDVCGKIHCVLNNASPQMKKVKNCSYFDSKVTDGESNMRIFGYDADVQWKLFEFQEKGSPVCLSNCTVKRARNGSNLEVFLRKTTGVEESDKTFNVSSVSKSCEVMKLCDIDGLPCFCHITVVAKVIHLGETSTVPKGLCKQELLIGDASGTARLTVWENEVGLMKEGGSYKLTGVAVSRKWMM